MIINDWLQQIKASNTGYELINKCGIYNDMWFFIKSDSINELFNIIKSYGFEYSEKKQVPDYYKTDLFNQYCFYKDNYQLLISVPNNGIVFSPNSCYGQLCKNNEINFKYDFKIQFSIFSDATKIKDLIIDITESFILKNKIQSTIATVNCKNETFSFFSNFINEV